MKVPIAYSLFLSASLALTIGCGRKAASDFVSTSPTPPPLPTPSVYEPEGKSLPAQEAEQDTPLPTPSPSAQAATNSAAKTWRDLRRSIQTDLSNIRPLSDDPNTNVESAVELARRLGQYGPELERVQKQLQDEEHKKNRENQGD